MKTSGPRLIIGVGADYRRDDGVGLTVAAALQSVAGLTVLSLPGEGTELINAWTNPGPPDPDWAEVVVIDAMRADAPPGAIFRFDGLRDPLPVAAFSCSSHRFGLAEAVEMARLLERLPRRLTIIGVAGGDFSQGQGLTPAVERAAARLIGELALK